MANVDWLCSCYGNSDKKLTRKVLSTKNCIEMPQNTGEVSVDSHATGDEEGGTGDSQNNDEVTDVSQEPEPPPAPVRKMPFDAMRNEPLMSNVLVDIYDGETDDQGFLHGFGSAYFQGGNVYTGEFDRGLMHGKGKYVWSDKTAYEGDFVMNQLCGHGVYIWPDGSVYEGEVKDGLRHGEGTFKCSSLRCIYSGMWCKGKRDGPGNLKYDKDGMSYYDGNWLENQRHGYGTRKYASGNVYEGEWKDNVRHGQGTMHWYTSNEQYSGQWLNGIQHGCGEHTWFLRRVKGSQYPLRNRYVGYWVNGLRHGRGVFHYANGAMYDGEWVNNMKHGKGMFVFKNGMVFKGLFESDHMLDFPNINPSGMITPDITSVGLPVRPTTPASSVLSGDCTTGLDLNIAFLFDDHDVDLDQREAEMQQVNFILLQHISKLKETYTYYSAIGNDSSVDNTSAMTKMQFCRFLKDCKVHHCGISLPEILRLISKDQDEKDPHNPWQNILMRDFLTALVTVAYHMFFSEHCHGNQLLLPWCLSKLITENVQPHACSVSGVVYSKVNTAPQLKQYFQKSYSVFQFWTQPRKASPYDNSMDMRQFLWMLKDYNLVNQNLTAKKVISCLASDDPRVVQDEFINLEIEMSFLEFIEALVNCAIVYVTDSLLSESPTPRQSTAALSQCPSVRSHVSTVTMRPVETPENDSRMSCHLALNVTEKPEGERSPPLEQKQGDTHPESPLKNVEIPFLSITASSADDPNCTSVPIPGIPSREAVDGQADDNLGDTQELAQVPRTRKPGEGPRTVYDGTKKEDDFAKWCSKMSYFFEKTFFPAADKHEILKKIANDV